MDRRAMFTPAFREFLEGQKTVTHETRTQKRFPGDKAGEFKFINGEWEPVSEPNYKQEIVPQTLTEDDVQHNRWPAAVYRFTLANGQVIETFVQSSRDFLSHNLTMDFMGLRRIVEGKEPVILDELSWTVAEMNECLPSVVGNSRGTNRQIKGLNVTEPEPVRA